MDRKEFIKKSAGLLILGGISLAGIAAKQEETKKKYRVVTQRCDGCGHCYKACRDQALTPTDDRKAVIDQQKCKGCGDCVRFCRHMAIVEQKQNEQG